MCTQLDEFGCLGTTIKLSSGRYIDLLNPEPAAISLDVIATALAKICRFGGHCPGFYSVAEHCVHAAVLAWEDGASLKLQRSLLLHDAAEAFIGDVVKPLKQVLPAYEEIEERFSQAIEHRFGVDLNDPAIKRYDRQMLKAEKMFLWPNDREIWSGFESVETRSVALCLHEYRMARSCYLLTAEALKIR